MSKTKRVSFTPAMREKVRARTNNHCHICGTDLAGKKMYVDHVVPYANGGTDDLDNLLPSCFDCNRYRWFYGPDTIQRLFKWGVWAKEEIQKSPKTDLGRMFNEHFTRKEQQNAKRRKKKS